MQLLVWLVILTLVACGPRATTPAPPAAQNVAPTATPAAMPTTTAAPRPQPTSVPTAKLAVVATFTVLGDLVKAVGGDRIELALLVGPGQDAHTFQPTPADAARLARADLLFVNGLGFEGWLEELYRASGSKAKHVVLTEGISAQTGGHAHAEGAAEEAHADGELDPHVWHDVRHAIHMVGRVGDALVQADPANAALYRSNAERYAAELSQLDAWVVEQVQSLPESRRTMVTNHDSFSYFASRYGFAVLGTALSGVSTESSEPTAADVAKLVRRIKGAGVPAVFVENVANPKLIERVAREAGVKVAPPLYTDAIGAAGSPVDSYPKMVRHNVTTIVTSLKA